MGQHRDVVSCKAARHPSKINPLQVFQKDNFFTEDPPAETIRPREVAKKNDFFCRRRPAAQAQKNYFFSSRRPAAWRSKKSLF